VERVVVEIQFEFTTDVTNILCLLTSTEFM